MDPAVRAHIRTEIAFWAAADKRSVQEGPAWMWTGEARGPLRASDLPPGLAEKVRERQAAGLSSTGKAQNVGARQLRLPPGVRDRPKTMQWGILAAAALVCAVIALAGADSAAAIVTVTAKIGLGSIFAVVCLLVGVRIWERFDPLRLDALERRAIEASRRRLAWRPLAGTGRIGPAGAVLLTGNEYISEIANSSAWTYPELEAHRGRFDAEEELFQLALSARRLAVLDSTTDYEHLVPVAEAQQERDELYRALVDRICALHECVLVLQDIDGPRSGVDFPPADVAAARLPSVTAQDPFVASSASTLAAQDLSLLAQDLHIAAQSVREIAPPPL